MANRATYQGSVGSFYTKLVELMALVSFGNTGAPTLITARSRGVVGVTRKSTGIFTIQFGATVNSASKLDAYVGLEHFEYVPDLAAYGTGVTSAVNGKGAILRNDLGSGVNLAPPVQAAVVGATSGGSLLDSTPYYWVVTAVDAGGKESLVSNERTITTGNSGSNVCKATISWTNPAGTVRNRVYRGTATGAQTIVYDMAATTSYVDTGAASSAAAATTTAAAIQARPPFKACSITVQLLSDAGAAADPASGEMGRFVFRLLDTSAG